MKTLDWNHVRAFLATATTGSLSAAARQLGATQPTLSRQVAALEASLGVRLFDRFGRRLVPTAAGLELLAHVRPMGEAAEALALAADGKVEAIRGRVSISASDSVATYLLPACLARLRAEAPALSIEIRAENEISDLHRREADIAVRHGPPDRPGLSGLHVRDDEAVFYAAPAWVAANGMPRSPADVAAADILGFTEVERYAVYLRALGFDVEADGLQLSASSAVAILEMVRQGLGVAPLSRDLAARCPELVPVLPSLAPIVVPIWLIVHEALAASPRIRLVRRVLAEELARPAV